MILNFRSFSWFIWLAAWCHLWSVWFLSAMLAVPKCVTLWHEEEENVSFPPFLCWLFVNFWCRLPFLSSLNWDVIYSNFDRILMSPFCVESPPLTRSVSFCSLIISFFFSSLLCRWFCWWCFWRSFMLQKECVFFVIFVESSFYVSYRMLFLLFTQDTEFLLVWLWWHFFWNVVCWIFTVYFMLFLNLRVVDDWVDSVDESTVYFGDFMINRGFLFCATVRFSIKYPFSMDAALPRLSGVFWTVYYGAHRHLLPILFLSEWGWVRSVNLFVWNVFVRSRSYGD